jgi:C1A family cysteine protease
MSGSKLVTPKLGYFLGRNRDPHDVRDHVLRMMKPVRDQVGDIDVTTGLSLPTYDQLNLGGCTGNAGAFFRRWLCQKFLRYSANDQELSRLFLYYAERALPWNNSTAEDSGANMRDICYVLAHTGIPPEADDPYIVADFANQPSANSYTDAALYKIGAYHRVPDADTVISCLVSGYPVLLGFTVYESFEDIGSDGLMPMPGKNEQIIGGHATVIIGYYSAQKLFLVQNSWGTSFGKNGKFLMPEAFLDNPDMSQFDSWVLHLGPAWK